MEHQSLFILGRQPAIGRAELESLFGAEQVRPVGEHGSLVNVPSIDIPFDRIGSSVRLARPLAEVPSDNWTSIQKYLLEHISEYLDYLPKEGKIKLGLSVFGIPGAHKQLLRTGLELKKAIKQAGRSVRVVPNTEPILNSGQVLHNQLTGEMGIELLCLKNGNKTLIGWTIKIQDVTAYAKRDQGRPKRDAFVGMLPPKLAQTIVNLGTGQLAPSSEKTILDPFCGTGVLLQEALLMGYNAYGSDIEPRMIDYSQKNLAWLATQGVDHSNPALEVGDATSHQWTHPFSVVACETYLGRPLSSWPRPEKLHEIIGTCNVIVTKFLQNLAQQIPSGTRLCLAVPAWQAPNGQVHHLGILDQLNVLGYNRVSFSWAQEQEMVYRRPDQLVARELLVITRK